MLQLDVEDCWMTDWIKLAWPYLCTQLLTMGWISSINTTYITMVHVQVCSCMYVWNWSDNCNNTWDSFNQAASSTKHLLASFPSSAGGEKHSLRRLHYWSLIQTSLDETPCTSTQSMLLEVGWVQKWREKAWSILSHEWHQCLSIGRQKGEGSPIKRMSLRHFLTVSVPST